MSSKNTVIHVFFLVKIYHNNSSCCRLIIIGKGNFYAIFVINFLYLTFLLTEPKFSFQFEALLIAWREVAQEQNGFLKNKIK